MSELRREAAYWDKQEPTDEQKWNDRLYEIKKEGAIKLVSATVDDPASKLASIIQLALDGVPSCDIGLRVESIANRMVEERAHPFLQKQSD